MTLAGAARRLGAAVAGRQVAPEAVPDLVERIEALVAEIETAPLLTKAEDFARNNRVAHYLEHGAWPDPPPEGARIEFDPYSVVGGELSPYSMGARYYRDGDEVVGRVELGRCFEGPPDRAHGGVIMAIFDEVLSAVFRARGTASAFTGELTVRLERPAPLGVELEFRGRQVNQEGRRRFIEGEATDPDGTVFARSHGIFIEIRPEDYGLSTSSGG